MGKPKATKVWSLTKEGEELVDAVQDIIRGDRPKYDVSYRCPWCTRIDHDVEKARLHSLMCDKKTGTLWSRLNKLSKRELRDIVKT